MLHPPKPRSLDLILSPTQLFPILLRSSQNRPPYDPRPRTQAAKYPSLAGLEKKRKKPELGTGPRRVRVRRSPAIAKSSRSRLTAGTGGHGGVHGSEFPFLADLPFLPSSAAPPACGLGAEAEKPCAQPGVQTNAPTAGWSGRAAGGAGPRWADKRQQSLTTEQTSAQNDAACARTSQLKQTA